MMETAKLAAGAVLQNRYRILSLLNQGGMGRVYLAEDVRFRSQVAVKEAYRAQEDFRRAFAREAGLLHRLRHRVLPHVSDYFTEGEAQYLVMQLFPGKDLDELLDEKLEMTSEAFAVSQVLRWADQLLDALEYLHSHQPPIVHRDIKPQNLKLTAQGDVVLLDFGLAKGVVVEMSQMDESFPGYTRQYAPLEQIRGAGTDPRSDLYALAATIYRLITGRVPPDALTRATAALEGRPDPLLPANKLNEQTPEAVAAALTRAMAQLPDNRTSTATEMRQALRAAVKPQAPDYYDTASPVNGIDVAWIKSSTLSEEPVTGLLDAAKFLVPEVTNAGQIVAPSSKPGADEPGAGAAFARFRVGGAGTAYIALCLLLAAIAALACWRLNPLSDSGAADQPAGKTLHDGSTSAPFVEAMRYYLQVESEIGRTAPLADANPVVRGRWLKFHFEPNWRGYLYIVAPGERAARVTFLTGQPNSAWGVKSNLLDAGIDYSFPPGPDKWIEVTSGSRFRTYTIIFTPGPLAQPRFLAEAADHVLTEAEEGELAELRKQFGQSARVETQGANSIITIPADRGSGAPFLFEINLSQEEGNQKR